MYMNDYCLIWVGQVVLYTHTHTHIYIYVCMCGWVGAYKHSAKMITCQSITGDVSHNKYIGFNKKCD